MHPVLLKGQGLAIERPARAAGMLVGAGASAGALLLALALLLKAAGWPISFPQFLAYAGAALLVVLAGVFGFWTYACASMRYALDRSGLAVHWGFLTHFIAMDRIESVVNGRGEQRPQIRGLGWLGYHVGKGEVEGIGSVLFFSTHRSPEDIVYVKAGPATYALSPRDPMRFMGEVQRFKQAGSTGGGRATVERSILAAHPIWSDRTAQWLALAAVALNVALWGYVFAVYPDLSNEITIRFPPVGDITTLHSRIQILKIPASATAILLANLLAALGFQWKERAAAYLLLSGAIFFQAVLWIAAGVAVVNA